MLKSFFGTVEKGIQWLKSRPTKEMIQITKVTDKRSNQQNRLYWMYLELIESETGNNKEEIHEYCKRIFLPVKLSKIVLKDGETIQYQRPTSTTELDKEEFSRYMDKIQTLTEVPIPVIE